MDKFKIITTAQAPRVTPGTIMFLPPKEQLCNDVYTDPELQIGAYNHPVAIISCPQEQAMNLHSLVEIAIMTSFNGTSLRKRLAAKGIEVRTEVLAAQRAGYLRVATASKPYAHDTLKLRNGKGMKRDCSYVGIGKTYKVQLGVLALYGSGKETADAYRLTAHATKKLMEAVSDKATTRWQSRGVRNYLVEGPQTQKINKESQREVPEEKVKKPNMRAKKGEQQKEKVERSIFETKIVKRNRVGHSLRQPRRGC